jgi:uncharacterized protein (UPF0332 family)
MSPDQQAMLRKAEQSLAGAHVLTEEGFYGFAASRAYYAMFYAAEALLQSLGLAFSKHSAVHAAYGVQFAATALLPPHFHRYLLEAQEARHFGDYDFGPEMPRADAEEQIRRAIDFLAAARGYLESVER